MAFTDAERAAWVALSTVNGIGPKHFSLLMSHFGSASAILSASNETLSHLAVSEKIQHNLHAAQTQDRHRLLDSLQKQGIVPLTLKDDGYPPLLREIPDPPFVLFVRGDVSLLTSPCFAVVGTRKMTAYGQTVTAELTMSLVAFGYTIVSGLAYGVDAIAHRATLEAGGKTIAVLGCGVDCIYPRRHTQLATTILDRHGAIVAEPPPGRWVSRGSFPSRNRIISGLSLGVLITEAAKDSGSLITARLATEQGREVFAIPGPITSRFAEGTNTLIQQGAKLIRRAEEIRDELPPLPSLVRSNPAAPPSASTEEQILLSLLAREPRSIDGLINASGFPSAKVTTILSMMELKGKIALAPDGTYMARM